jgi:hypothetical protein
VETGTLLSRQRSFQNPGPRLAHISTICTCREVTAHFYLRRGITSLNLSGPAIGVYSTSPDLADLVLDLAERLPPLRNSVLVLYIAANVFLMAEL